MACGLSRDELFILNILYTSRCLTTRAGYHCEKLEGIYIRKHSSKFNKAIKKMQKKGFIAAINKRKTKYYISNIPLAFGALDAHEYTVTQGKTRPL